MKEPLESVSIFHKSVRKGRESKLFWTNLPHVVNTRDHLVTTSMEQFVAWNKQKRSEQKQNRITTHRYTLNSFSRNGTFLPESPLILGKPGLGPVFEPHSHSFSQLTYEILCRERRGRRSWSSYEIGRAVEVYHFFLLANTSYEGVAFFSINKNQNSPTRIPIGTALAKSINFVHATMACEIA